MKNMIHRLLIRNLLPASIMVMLIASCKKTPETTSNTSSSTIIAAPNDTLAQSIYTINRTSSTGSSGTILVSPYGPGSFDPGLLMSMNGAGQVLMEKATTSGALDFRRWTIDGKTRYTWSVYDPASYVIPVISQPTGYTVIADSNLNEIKRVSLLAHNNITVSQNEGSDVHDFILLSDDHYITMTYYQKTVSNVPDSLSSTGQALVVAPIIQEVNNGVVVWQWDGTDYPEFYSTSVETNDFTQMTKPQDYMHMNAMIIDPKDNNLICSFRTLNQIVKLNRQTGSIVWRLGGKNSDFPLGSDQKFLRQHDVSLTDNDGTLLIFDNGEATERPYTRIVEFQLDESAKQVTGFKSYTVPEPFTQFMGSVQKTGDHYFIGGGTAKYVLDVNYVTGEKTLEMIGTLYTYRAFKY